MNTGKIIVSAWVKLPGSERFHYKFVWSGGSILQAIWNAWNAKAYSGCVKIEWRGTR